MWLTDRKITRIFISTYKEMFVLSFLFFITSWDQKPLSLSLAKLKITLKECNSDRYRRPNDVKGVKKRKINGILPRSNKKS
jgi:hypothetical protein